MFRKCVYEVHLISKDRLLFFFFFGFCGRRGVVEPDSLKLFLNAIVKALNVCVMVGWVEELRAVEPFRFMRYYFPY